MKESSRSWHSVISNRSAGPLHANNTGIEGPPLEQEAQCSFPQGHFPGLLLAIRLQIPSGQNLAFWLVYSPHLSSAVSRIHRLCDPGVCRQLLQGASCSGTGRRVFHCKSMLYSLNHSCHELQTCCLYLWLWASFASKRDAKNVFSSQEGKWSGCLVSSGNYFFLEQQCNSSPFWETYS